MRRISTGRRAAIGAVAVMATLTGTTGVATADPASTATITIDTAHPAGRLASDFVGLSFEMRELGIGNLDATKGNAAALFRTLGRSNVRISGNTLDRDTLWVPQGRQPPNPLPEWVNDVVTPTDVKRLGRFLSVTGWDTMVGINLGRWDEALGRDQARSMSSILGDRLVAAQCGNEPDQWVGKGFRPVGYAYADYREDWRTCAAAVGGKRVAGPDTAGTSSTWAASLAADEKDRMSMVTVHQYSAGPDATIATLLSPTTVTNQLRSVSKNLEAAKANGLEFRVDEANSAYSGGVDGVSNRYASALWGLDYSLQMAQAGVDGINVHGGLGVCNDPIWNGKFQRYTPICAANAADEQAKVYKAMPIYYGLWMARQMKSGRFLPLTLSTDRNVTAYAVKGDDGRTRIAVVQKDETTAAPVHLDIAVDRRARGAEVLRLTGNSLDGETTSVQGATVDRQGHLKPKRAEQVRVRDGELGVDVAAGSAVIITLDGC